MNQRILISVVVLVGVGCVLLSVLAMLSLVIGAG